MSPAESLLVSSPLSWDEQHRRLLVAVCPDEAAAYRFAGLLRAELARLGCERRWPLEVAAGGQVWAVDRPYGWQ